MSRVDEILAEMEALRNDLRRSIAFQTQDVDSRTEMWMRREDLRAELERIQGTSNRPLSEACR